MGRKTPLAVLCALLSAAPAPAQIARLPVPSAPLAAAAVAAPSASAAAPFLAPALAAPSAPVSAFALPAAAPILAAAPAPAAGPALQAVAAVPAALASPESPSESAKGEAGRVFDQAAGPAPDGGVLVPQVLERLSTLAQRTVGLPAHFWPFSRLARLVAHGEPLVGLTPGGAARAAERLASEGGIVVGRLAWELRDPWSIRGAERSYLRLIEKLAAAKARRTDLDAAVSLDAESLGLQLRGVSAPERERLAGDAILRLARASWARGLPVELDMGTSDAMPAIARIAARVVREAGIPVRLALAARYRSSETILNEWDALARETGLRLGVRLVKGSFIEASQPDAINDERALVARYKELVTLALERGARLDVAVASHNREIWEHARRESRRLGADFTMHVIRGVHPELQAEMRAAGKIGRQYVSYGLDAPVMGLTELYTNWKQSRALAARYSDLGRR